MRRDWLVRMKPDCGCVLPWRPAVDGQPLDLTAPAILAVTDFKYEQPQTVDEDRPIDAALKDMIRLGVRALIVLKERRTVGLITSYDIQGERPMQVLLSANYSRHGDIRVGDVMTPWVELVALDWGRLIGGSIGDVLTLLKDTELTHVLVLDADEDGSHSVLRGIISRTRIERRLGALRHAS